MQYIFKTHDGIHCIPSQLVRVFVTLKSIFMVKSNILKPGLIGPWRRAYKQYILNEIDATENPGIPNLSENLDF